MWGFLVWSISLILLVPTVGWDTSHFSIAVCLLPKLFWNLVKLHHLLAEVRKKKCMTYFWFGFAFLIWHPCPSATHLLLLSLMFLFLRWTPLCFFFFFNFSFLYFWDRERQSVSRGGEERGGDTDSEQAPGSEPSAQSSTQGSNSWTARQWPEPKVSRLTDWATQAPRRWTPLYIYTWVFLSWKWQVVSSWNVLHL